jgi:glycosyltransferase involved in cell wall biosynthesis
LKRAGEANVSGRTSVIIPCYNGEAFLGEALDSVRAQTRAAHEIIVIDDGSKIPVTAPAGWDGPPLRIVRTPNRGLPAARNLAIELATGEFVALLDADDAWAPAKLERQEDALAARPGVAAAFTHVVPKPGWLPIPPRDYPPPEVTEEAFWARLWEKNFITPSSVMIRRATALAVGGFDRGLRYCEDWEFWFRLLRAGGFVQVAQPLCYYRKHPHQMTKHSYPMIRYWRQARLQIMAKHGDRLEAAGISRERQQENARQEYRGHVLLPFFQRELGAARRLLWGYLLRHPHDLQVLKYAFLSLLPRWLLVRLRGQMTLP